MRVTAAVAPRMASGDPAASKGKSAGGASFGKRRVGREERCAAPHARAVHFLHMQFKLPRVGIAGASCVSRPLRTQASAEPSAFWRGKFFLTLPRVRVFAGGLSAGCGLDAGRAGG